MTKILPQAQHLAESNGIDWYALRGTGDSGVITENDVLSHLAAIMMGDVDAPLTPVDEPPPDWNGSFDLNPEMLQAAGMDEDTLQMVGEAAQSMRQAAPLAPEPAVVAFTPEPAVSLAPAPAPAPIEVAARLDTSAGAPTVPVVTAAPAPIPVPTVPAVTTPVMAVPAPAAEHRSTPPAAEPPRKAGLSGLLGRLYGRPTPPPTPTVQPPVPVLPVHPPEAPAATPALDHAPVTVHAPTAPADHLVEPVLDTPVSAPVTTDAPMPPAAPTDEPGVSPEAPAPVPQVPAGPEGTPVDAEEALQAAEDTVTPESTEESPLLPAASDPGVHTPVPADELLSESQPPVAADPAPAAAEAPLPAQAAHSRTWRGTFMRRSCPAPAYLSFKRQVEHALETDLSDAQLVAHAAQRLVSVVGRQQVTYHLGAQAFTPDLPLRRTQLSGTPVHQPGDVIVVSGSPAHVSQPDALLLMADVHGGELSLGLLGEVDVDRGAAFLKEIGTLLQNPVALLL